MGIIFKVIFGYEVQMNMYLFYILSKSVSLMCKTFIKLINIHVSTKKYIQIIEFRWICVTNENHGNINTVHSSYLHRKSLHQIISIVYVQFNS